MPLLLPTWALNHPLQAAPAIPGRERVSRARQATSKSRATPGYRPSLQKPGTKFNESSADGGPFSVGRKPSPVNQQGMGQNGCLLYFRRTTASHLPQLDKLQIER